MILIPQYLVKERSYTSDTGVIQIELPKNEQISAIVVEIDATVSSTLDATNSILHCVTKLEVLLEGAGVAYSMTPESNSYDYLMRSGDVPPHSLSDNHGSEDIMRCIILFGRYPGDDKYLLDTALYEGCTLSIPYVLDTTDFNTTTLDATIYYLRPLKKVSPVGFIRGRTISEYTTTGSAHIKVINLPSGLPWQSVFTRIYDIDEYLYANVTDIKFEIDDGRVRLFDGRIEELITLERMRFGGDYRGNILSGIGSDSDYVQSFMALGRHFDLLPFHSTQNIVKYSSWKGHHFKLAMHLHDGTTQTADARYTGFAWGSAYMGGLILAEFLDEPYPATEHADARIEYVCGANTALIETNLVEVVSGRL